MSRDREVPGAAKSTDTEGRMMAAGAGGRKEWGVSVGQTWGFVWGQEQALEGAGGGRTGMSD